MSRKQYVNDVVQEVCDRNFFTDLGKEITDVHRFKIQAIVEETIEATPTRALKQPEFRRALVDQTRDDITHSVIEELVASPTGEFTVDLRNPTTTFANNVSIKQFVENILSIQGISEQFIICSPIMLSVLQATSHVTWRGSPEYEASTSLDDGQYVGDVIVEKTEYPAFATIRLPSDIGAIVHYKGDDGLLYIVKINLEANFA